MASKQKYTLKNTKLLKMVWSCTTRLSIKPLKRNSIRPSRESTVRMMKSVSTRNTIQLYVHWNCSVRTQSTCLMNLSTIIRIMSVRKRCFLIWENTITEGGDTEMHLSILKKSINMNFPKKNRSNTNLN